MSTLINKELVEKAGNPARYMLTDSGRSLAITLDQAESALHNSPTTIGADLGRTNVTVSNLNPPAKVKKPFVAKPGNVQVKKTMPPSSFQELRTTTPVNQPSDIICLDGDDEFDRYNLDTSPLSNLNERCASSKPANYLSHNNAPVQIPINNTLISKAAPVSKPAASTSHAKEAVLEPEEDYSDYVYEKLTFKPGDYDIVLCVDSAEVSGY